MEIRFENIKLKDNTLNFTIKDKEINGITGKDLEEIIKIINIRANYKGKIYINGEELEKDNQNNIKKKINTIKEELEFTYKTTVYDLLSYEIVRRNLVIKNPSKKINDSLRIVGLDIDLINREIKTLSSSEKKILQLAISLLSNPDVIVLIEPFKHLDMKNEKKLIMLLNKIREQYKKTIIFVTNNSNILYKYTSHLIIYKNEKILVEGNTEEIYKRVDFLSRNKISIPEIVEFTYFANKKKNAHIDYHKDIRDIIKDIYKHV